MSSNVCVEGTPARICTVSTPPQATCQPDSAFIKREQSVNLHATNVSRMRRRSVVEVASPVQSRILPSPNPKLMHSCFTSCSSFSVRATMQLSESVMAFR